MDFNKTKLRSIAGYGALLILLYWSLHNLKLLGGWTTSILSLFLPFILGLVLAFIINVPMVQIEKILFKKAKGRLKSMSRMLSLVLTIALLVGLIFVVLFLVVPQLAGSITMLGNSIPGYINEASRWATQLTLQYPELFQSFASINMDWNSILNSTMSFIESAFTSLLTSTVNIAAGVFSGLLSFFLAVVFAVYILLQKEALREQAVKVLYSFAPKGRSDRLMYIAALTNRTFTSFLSGQCLEAIILGILFFISMSILRLPYALMISVLTGFTALIPIFGAFIGCAVGAFLILMVNPMQALWFLILFIIIQQLEGNLIYPKVVGGSIGLPAIWVLLAVTVGGSAMGIAGMLIFIPLCSVLYTLLWEAVEKRKTNGAPRREEVNEKIT